MIDIHKGVEFQQIRQENIIVGASWAPKGNVKPNKSADELDGKFIRRGDLTISIDLYNSDFSSIVISIRKDKDTNISKSCLTSSGGGTGCTVTFEDVDVCHVLSTNTQIKAAGRNRNQILSVSLAANYVVTKFNIVTKLMQRPGQEIIRKNVTRSSMCVER